MAGTACSDDVRATASATEIASATHVFTMRSTDQSRLAYSEVLTDQRKETAAGFRDRARDYFTSLGIEVSAVMTDNGSFA